MDDIPAFGVRYDCNIIRNSLEGVRSSLCSNHPNMASYSSLNIIDEQNIYPRMVTRPTLTILRHPAVFPGVDLNQLIHRDGW